MKKLILFDLGGVLVEFDFSDMMKMTRLSEAALWEKWLLSETVRDFESGRMGAESFARNLVAEFDLAIPPETLLARYVSWMVGLYPGAEALLRELAPSYALACLTNINALMWARAREKIDLDGLFDYQFASHEMGCLKPDREAYEFVIAAVPQAREAILFLDDNPLNVAGAQAAGLAAYQVKGPAAARARLVELGLLR